MKLLIAGGRDFGAKDIVIKHLNELILSGALPEDINEIEIVSGLANGADICGAYIATEHNLTLHEFPADWNTHGKSAGFVRNADMAKFLLQDEQANSFEQVNKALIFWDGVSRGTRNMLQLCQRFMIPHVLVKYQTNDLTNTHVEYKSWESGDVRCQRTISLS